MKKKMLLIRADANKKIGLGHVMRCLTIAEAAEMSGIETVFLLSDDSAEELLKERGQAYRILHTNFANMESELPTLFETVENDIQTQSGNSIFKVKSTEDKFCHSESLLKNKEITETVFLLDSYQITAAYMQELKAWLNKHNICLALMEDYGNVPYSADILINYNIYGINFSYEKNAPKSLLGCRYMPLRQPFTQQKYKIREQVQNILITTGGSDSYHIGTELVKQLTDKQFSSNQKLSVHVVCGKFSQSREELLQLAQQNSSITVHTDVKEMWTLMSGCDIAISAAGTTLYELCAIGVPTICFSFAENQILPGTAFGEHTPMYYAGDYEKDKTAMFTKILAKTEALCKMSKEHRQQISNTLKQVVDGQGASRIVSELFIQSEKKGART